LSETFVQAIRIGEGRAGRMKAVELNGREIVICNWRRSFHAVGPALRAHECPLEMDTGRLPFLPAPCIARNLMLRRGRRSSDPFPTTWGMSPFRPRWDISEQRRVFMQQIRTESVAIHKTKVESEYVWWRSPDFSSCFK